MLLMSSSSASSSSRSTLVALSGEPAQDMKEAVKPYESAALPLVVLTATMFLSGMPATMLSALACITLPKEPSPMEEVAICYYSWRQATHTCVAAHPFGGPQTTFPHPKRSLSAIPIQGRP